MGDFNGDGRDDVVSYHQASGTWWVNRSTGSGFVLEKWATFSTRVGWDPQLVGDFNGDGRDDVANYHPSNATWWASTADANAFVTTKWATIPIDTPSVFITTTNVPVVVIGHTPGGQYLVETPCGRQATIDPTGGTPIHGVDVVIDPGHGGSVDTGAVQNGIVERDLNLEVANTLHAELRSRGISAVLTRTANYAATLAQRARIADSANATLMVSIHHNSSLATPATSNSPGSEVYVQANAESQRLGKLLYDNVTATLAANYSLNWYHSSDAGVLRVVEPGGDESYGMIKRPVTPTALIELGWISNSAEATVYKTNAYPAAAADGLGQAIEAYLDGGVSSTGIGSRTFTAGPAPGTSQCTDPALD